MMQTYSGSRNEAVNDSQMIVNELLMTILRVKNRTTFVVSVQ
jgi:hypothetical protein